MFDFNSSMNFPCLTIKYTDLSIINDYSSDPAFTALYPSRYFEDI